MGMFSNGDGWLENFVAAIALAISVIVTIIRSPFRGGEEKWEEDSPEERKS